MAHHVERGVLWAAVLVSFFLGSCANDRGAKDQPAGSFFPMAKGNSWVFLKLGSGADSVFDEISIRFDSVRTGRNGLEHWYYLQSTSFLKERIWVRRDSVGDLWCTVRDFDTPEPFLLPSKDRGETWLWQRYCITPDTLHVSDAAVTLYLPSGDLLRGVLKISAKATCPKGDWEIYLARGIGPVSWSLGTVRWDLLRSRNLDDAPAAVGPSPERSMNPE